MRTLSQATKTSQKTQLDPIICQAYTIVYNQRMSKKKEPRQRFVRVDAEQYKQLVAIKNSYGVPVAQSVRMAIAAYLKKRREK